MRRKRPDIYQEQRESQHREYLSAPYLESEHPGVEEIAVYLEFTDPDGMGHPKSKDQTFSSGSRANFAYPCPFRECIGGGFNLRKIVSDTVARHLQEASGRVVCQGWQDRERINKHHCLLECNYRISVVYKSTNA